MVGPPGAGLGRRVVSGPPQGVPDQRPRRAPTAQRADAAAGRDGARRRAARTRRAAGAHGRRRPARVGAARLAAARGARGATPPCRAALPAPAVAWLFHGLYDWDLDTPGASIPAFAFLGVLAGRARPDGPLPNLPPTARAVGLALGTLAACAIGLSAILPAWADSKA